MIRRMTGLLVVLVLITGCAPQVTPEPLPTLAAAPSPEPTATEAVVATPVTAAGNDLSGTVLRLDQQSPATVRIVHAAPGIETVNLFTGIQAIATNLSFGLSTEPTPLESGEYELRVARIGGRPDDPALLETKLIVKGGEQFAVILAGSAETPELLVVPDSVLPLNPGESAATFINATTAGSSLEIVVSGETVVRDLVYGQQAATPVLRTGPSEVTVRNGDSILLTNTLEFRDGQYQSLVVAGGPGNTSLVEWSTRSPGRVSARVINASIEVTTVDVLLNDEVIAEGVGFGRASERIPIAEGAYRLRVFSSGGNRQDTQPLYDQTLGLSAGADMALIVSGPAAKIQISPYVENRLPTAAGRTRIAFFNPLAHLPSIELETSGGPLPDIAPLGYGATPRSTTLSAGRYSFFSNSVSGTSERNTVEIVENVELVQGYSYLYLISGNADNNPIILSDQVGFDESLSPENDQTMPVRTDGEAAVRVINALEDRTGAAVMVNGQTLVNEVPYGAGSALVAAPAQNLTLAIKINGQSGPALTTEQRVEKEERYTILIYGPSASDVRLLLIPDRGLIVDANSPYLRLINASPNADTHLGLGFGQPIFTPAPGATTESEGEDIRRTIPFGLQRLIEGIAGGSASNVILMPRGRFDIHVLDSAQDQLAATIRSVDLAGGQHMDVVAYQERDSQRIHAFVVPYPANGD